MWLVKLQDFGILTGQSQFAIFYTMGGYMTATSI